MSDQVISIILYVTTIIIGLVAGLFVINIITPIAVGAFVGLIAGYFSEKHNRRMRYDERYPFGLNRLDLWGGIRGAFLTALAYQLVTWI